MLTIIKRGILLAWHLQDCNNILRTLGIVHKDNSWCIVSEYAAHGNLHTFMRLYIIDKATKINMVRQIAIGLSYLHSCNVIHKDLRSHNVVVDTGLVPKITGFEVYRDASHATTQITIDPFVRKWWSPERQEGLRSSMNSDVYAFGVLMYEVSIAPNAFENIDLAFEMGMIHPTYSEIMRQCLSQNPSDRPTVDHVVQLLTDLQSLPIDIKQ